MCVCVCLHLNSFSSCFTCKASTWPPFQLEETWWSIQLPPTTHTPPHSTRKYIGCEISGLTVSNYHWLLGSKTMLFLFTHLGKVKHVWTKNCLSSFTFFLTKEAKLNTQVNLQFSSIVYHLYVGNSYVMLVHS